MKESIVFVLFHFQEKNNLSYDCRLRVDATAHFLVSYKTIRKVILVGGGGLEVSGAQQMKKYWETTYQKYFSWVSLRTLEGSNSTHANIDEIKSFIQKDVLKEVFIITNGYHIPRTEKLLENADIVATVVSAEKILLEDEFGKAEIEHYQKSFLYQRKLLQEKLLIFLMNPIAHRIFFLWRKIRYLK